MPTTQSPTRPARPFRRATGLLGAALLALCAGAQAQDIKLPQSLTMTAYDTGSSGFNMAVAIGKMMKERHGSELRVLPGGNDIARLSPLKAGRAQASAMGVGGYFAQEGVFEFGVKEWGPQALQLMLASTSCNGLSLGVTKDAGVKEVKDLRGKRIGFVVGSPALNQNALAVIAFGGLTREDVRIVEFSSYGAMWKGLVNNEADAAFASTISGQAREVDSSPRGLMWPSTPAEDKAGWARVNKVGPYFYPHKAECGAGGISKENPVVMPAYPYPIFMAYNTQPAELIHGITKSMIVNYADYKDGAPGADGLELKRQNLSWVLPYHEGAVRALKEAGVWTPAAQAHNDALLKRQATLQAAWADYTKASPPEDKDAFYKGWMAKRKDALSKAGMDPVF
ncbi:MAG: C4-dicarboxylate transporter [Proteobacteria bacterium]|jgi:TRAP transporter TAXI family solute receptor|nr:C4-dicarboxylate transporter [Pseudomonadota bacterium]